MEYSPKKVKSNKKTTFEDLENISHNKNENS